MKKLLKGEYERTDIASSIALPKCLGWGQRVGFLTDSEAQVLKGSPSLEVYFC